MGTNLKENVGLCFLLPPQEAGAAQRGLCHSCPIKKYFSSPKLVCPVLKENVGLCFLLPPQEAGAAQRGLCHSCPIKKYFSSPKLVCPVLSSNTLANDKSLQTQSTSWSLTCPDSKLKTNINPKLEFEWTFSPPPEREGQRNCQVNLIRVEPCNSTLVSAGGDGFGQSLWGTKSSSSEGHFTH